ncbi:MAG: hypothetical protein ACXVAZ_14495, partial [Mucilaginibacter sp.]
MRLLRILFVLFMLLFVLSETNAQQKRLTYCNPLNLDYGYTPFKDFSKWGKHRATADPTVTL